jgi:hypothetical protein
LNETVGADWTTATSAKQQTKEKKWGLYISSGNISVAWLSRVKLNDSLASSRSTVKPLQRLFSFYSQTLLQNGRSFRTVLYFPKRQNAISTSQFLPYVSHLASRTLSSVDVMKFHACGFTQRNKSQYVTRKETPFFVPHTRNNIFTSVGFSEWSWKKEIQKTFCIPNILFNSGRMK